MKKWKKYFLASVLIIVVIAIFAVANGALKRVSIDRTLEDLIEMRLVVSEYIEGDVENTPATEARLMVEEIYNRDRYMKIGTPQKADVDYYDVGNIEMEMEYYKIAMNNMDNHNDNPAEKIKIAERIRKNMKLAEELMWRK